NDYFLQKKIMTFNFIKPEIFDSSVQLIIGTFKIIVAAGTFYITCLMYGVATRALTTWKDQRVDNIETEAKVKSVDALRLLIELYSIGFDQKYLEDYQIETGNKLFKIDPELWKVYMNRETFWKKYQAKSDNINHIRGILIKVNKYSSDTEIKSFYEDVIRFEAYLTTIVSSYWNELINSYIDKYNIKIIDKHTLQPTPITFLGEIGPGISPDEYNSILYTLYIEKQEEVWLKDLRSRQISFFNFSR